jgi:hypothetical protein
MRAMRSCQVDEFVYEYGCDVNEDVGMYKGQDPYVMDKVYKVMLKDVEGEGGSFQR